VNKSMVFFLTIYGCCVDLSASSTDLNEVLTPPHPLSHPMSPPSDHHCQTQFTDNNIYLPEPSSLMIDLVNTPLRSTTSKSLHEQRENVNINSKSVQVTPFLLSQSTNQDDLGNDRYLDMVSLLGGSEHFIHPVQVLNQSSCTLIVDIFQ
jgi:hypothetical protein